MKKYLGSAVTAFAAVVAPLFVILPLVFGVVILASKISVGTVFMLLMCGFCSVIWLIYLKRESFQLYTWGIFENTCVRIRSPFISEIILDYDKCKDVGIGCYTHGILNSHIGSKVYFIYLSYDCFEEQYREKINLWKPTTRRIKVQFSESLLEYLRSCLPERKAKMLEESYGKFYLDQKKQNIK